MTLLILTVQQGLAQLFVTAIVLLCAVAASVIFWQNLKRQKHAHEAVIRGLYQQELELASHIAEQQLHQNVINGGLKPVFGYLNDLHQRVGDGQAWRVQQVVEALEQLESRIRDVSNDIFPPGLLTDFAFVCQYRVNTLARLYGYTGQLPINVTGDFADLTNQRVLLYGLYGLIDLFVSNSLKHAQASQITVTLTRHPTTIVLDMTDNGQGFDLGAALQPDPSFRSRGLADFRARALSIALSARLFTFYSTENVGTFFNATIPIPSEPA